MQEFNIITENTSFVLETESRYVTASPMNGADPKLVI